MIGILEVFIVFIIYSFIGYIVEVLWRTFETKKLLNRGFLVGPIIPIFGVGAVLITHFLTEYYSDPLVVFVFAVVLTSILEYIVGYLLEKIFHNRWWDYSTQWGNLEGRVCIINSIAFGFGALIIIYVTNPIIFSFLDRLSDITMLICGIILFLLFIGDLIYSTIVAYNLRTNIIVVEELKNMKINNITSYLESKLKAEMKRLKASPDRLLKSFPKLRDGMSKEFDIITKIRESLKNEKKKMKAKKD